MNKVTKVLVIDDSILVRKVMMDIVNEDPDLHLVGAAKNPYEAAEMMRRQKPDVIALDIEMPHMDGITFLAKLMSQHPIPVVVLSTLTRSSSRLGIKALECGAVEVLNKPNISVKESLAESAGYLVRVLKEASTIDVNKIAYSLQPDEENRFTRTDYFGDQWVENKVICIGASAGGTHALRQVLQPLPVNFPGMVIVQHMPASFTHQFASYLNSICSLDVKEAANGDVIRPGKVLLAPGGSHMMIRKGGDGYQVQIKDGPNVSMHKPSVDVLFRSAANHLNRNALGVILTGMGKDGAEGIKEMYDKGAFTIAQDESTSVVFGMPKVAIEKGGIHEIIKLKDIPHALVEWASRGHKKYANSLSRL